MEDRYKKEVEELKEQTEKDLDYYEYVWEVLSTENIGRASSDFFLSEGIVVLHKSDPAKFITLTANLGPTTIWKHNSSLYSTNSGDTIAASVSFSDEDWIDNTTKLIVKPQTKGTLLVEFTNEVNVLNRT